MQINSLLYTVKQGVKNIWRNKMFSLASIATMTACIFLFGLFYTIMTNFQALVESAEEGVAVTVYFNEGTSEEAMQEVGSQIEKRAEVSSVVFVSAEQAWEDFKAIYFEGKEEYADSFAEDNPLANAAHYEIYLSDVSMQDSLVTYLESFDIVREVHHSDVAANTLTDFNSLLKYISISIIIILFAVAIFLISNTVHVGISVRKEEIAIMKLIGATDFFVRAPFIVEGILIGLVGSIIPLIILYYLYNRIIIYIQGKFNFISSMLQFLPVNEVFHVLVPVSLLLGVGIGFLGSRITIRKHLKV